MAEGVSTFSWPAGHPVFAGHFPGRPIVPGVMLLEWVLGECARTRGVATSALRVREAKFFRPLQPDQSAELLLEPGAARLVFRIVHGEVAIASGIVEWDGDA